MTGISKQGSAPPAIRLRDSYNNNNNNSNGERFIVENEWKIPCGRYGNNNGRKKNNTCLLYTSVCVWKRWFPFDLL